MKFICTNKGRFSVYDPFHKQFAQFVNGEFETDKSFWLPILKNVQGVTLAFGSDVTTSVAYITPEPEQTPEKKPVGRPKKKVK
jgi:hypothetical protein